MREDVGSSYVRQRDTRMTARAQAIRRVTDDVTTTDEDDEWYPRMPKSALRLRDTRGERDEPSRSLAGQGSRDVMVHRVPRRASTLREKETDALPRLQGHARPRSRVHWLVVVGVALLIMGCGYWLLTIVANWWAVTQDNWHYGYPRTYQCDAVVGHNHDSATNPTHFIALNLNGQVEIIEIPAGDASKAKIYVGPSLVGTNANLAPVTLSFADVNGDGRLDLLIHVQGGQFVYLNTGSEFRPATPADHVTLPKS